jgi:hypothetical protein
MKSDNMLSLAMIAALRRAQEITFKYCHELVKEEKLWYELSYFKNLDKSIIKSIWRHYIK